MTDRHTEGMTASGYATLEEIFRVTGITLDPPEVALRIARAAVTAYLGHVHPVVDSVAELDALPVSTTVLCAEGWPWIHDSDGEGAWWWVRAGREEGFTSDEVPLPARVIHFGGSNE